MEFLKNIAALIKVKTAVTFAVMAVFLVLRTILCRKKTKKT